jgi:hypothetical protein
MRHTAALIPIVLIMSACDLSTTPKSTTPGADAAELSTDQSVLQGERSTPQNAGEAARCFDVYKAEPKELSGKLAYVMFAGPPEYEDVQKGDMPEPAYILKLNSKICITDDDEFADRDNLFDEVHLVPGKNNEDDLRKLVDQTVTVRLYKQIAADNRHHRRPLVAWVSQVAPAQKVVDVAYSDDDPTVDYGTPATTIRAFYSALRSGQGAIAASMIVPEKTQSGSFSPEELSRYYGSMRSPVELISLEPEGDGSYFVRYKFTVSGTACNGRAIINMTERNGRNYIKRIRALDGC